MFSLHVDTARTWRGGQNQVLLTVNGLRAIGHRAALVAHPDGELRRRAAALSPSERDSASERGRGWGPGRMKEEGLKVELADPSNLRPRSQVQVYLTLVRVHSIDKTTLRVVVGADLAPPGKELQPVGLATDIDAYIGVS